MTIQKAITRSARDGSRIGDGRDHTRQCAEPNTAHADIPINRPY